MRTSEKLAALVASGAAPATHNLSDTGVWSLLRQRFMSDALAATSVRTARGWTHLSYDDLVEAVEILLRGWSISDTGDETEHAWLASHTGTSVWIDLDRSGSWIVYAAGDDEKVADVLGRIAGAFPAPVYEPDDTEAPVTVRFWAMGAMGPFSYVRRLEAAPWTNVDSNYPADVAGTLSDLMASGEPEDDRAGRLLLWHGPAGTGKTHAIRALAQSWRAWCDIDYIVDADQFFGVAAYMVESLLGGYDDGRWRLVVIEDSGEFLKPDAFEHAGQGLSRLLNLADGLVGQGTRLLILMTTNEDVDELHAAVRRPGRCRQSLCFDEFDEDSATEWLVARGKKPADGPMTLAQMFAAPS